MEHKKEYVESLLRRYSEGVATKDEQLEVARWLSQLDASDRQLTNEKVYSRLIQSREELRARLLPDDRPTNEQARFVFPWWAAATIAIVSILSFLLYSMRPSQTADTNTLALRESITGVGQLRTIILPDSTRITLNSQSTLRFPDRFADSVREVFLTGEAFFDVKRNTERPFRVHADHAVVHVLGTAFNVKSYPGDKQLFVAVASGKVAVSSIRGQSRLLTPGDLLQIDRTTGVFQQTTIDTAGIQLWTTGGLRFQKEPLSAIATQLERRYGITFKFENEVLRHIELSLRTERTSLQTVMEALGISGGFHFRIDGRTVAVWK